MDITIMEGLQMALLTISTLAITALTAVLVRVFKILGPVLEILDIYKKVKNILWMYSQIPDTIKEKAMSFIKK